MKTTDPGSIRHRRVVIWIACVGLTLSLLPGCSNHEPKLKPNRTDVPFVFIRLYSGMTGPGQTPQFGTIAALWPDGTLVRAVSDDQVGKSYVKGSISADQLDMVRKAISETGILQEKSESMVVVDAASIHLNIRHEKGMQSWAYSPPIQKDDRITAIKKKLMSLPLSDESPVDAAPYKAYPHDWFK